MPKASPTIDSPAHQSIVSRPFRDDQDFWRIRRQAIESYAITPLGWNWDIRRWDGKRFHNEKPALDLRWQHSFRLWETVEHQLVGVVHPDGTGWFYLQLHPDFRKIEEEMIAWGEAHLHEKLSENNLRQVHLEVYEYDRERQQILERRGYEKQADYGVIRRMWLSSQTLPEANLAPGYRLRTIHSTDLEDCQRLADLLNAAFQRNFHTGNEFNTFARLAPCYRENLHLVAEAPDGSLAAHVGVIYDEANQRGLFEPVCTHPDHRRKKLAQNLMFAGLQRLVALGARQVTVDTGDMIPANALYDSIGFTETIKCYQWRKLW